MLDATGDRYSGSINFKGAGFPAPEPGFAGFSLCKGLFGMAAALTGEAIF